MNLQGVPRLLIQLWSGIFSVHFDRTQYPFNHLISTWGDFVWHMKHHDTFNGLQDTDGNSFWQVFSKSDFCVLTSTTKELELKTCSTMHNQYKLFWFVWLIFMENNYPCILIWEHLVNSNFCKEGYWRQNSNLQKSCQKLFPSVSDEPLKVPWCFICQTKSPYV